MRLDKFLSETTDLTRSLAKKALHREEVTVDGCIVKDASHQVSEGSEVRWLDTPLALVGLRYLMMHKPVGVECTTRPGLYPTVLALIDLPKVERLHPVGRLDVDTSGLVLLTDDGQWSHRVTSPRYRCDKVYRATLADALDEEAARAAIQVFSEGLWLDGESKQTQPAELTPLSPREMKVTLSEGRYHQVRRMFAAIGNRVETLHRESIGPIALDPDLAPGECRMLRQEEIDAF
ncbi:MAG: pseudouridine synthase [Halomonas sp.]|nr:pseudouridine synthase [Halomonas sp.]